MTLEKPYTFMRTHPPLEKQTRERAKQLRRQATKEERRLWGILQNNQIGVKFRRQQPIGNYVADFYCAPLRLVIEVDGGQHGSPRDSVRDQYMADRGITVLRFWNNDVLMNLNGVGKKIATTIFELSSRAHVAQ